MLTDKQTNLVHLSASRTASRIRAMMKACEDAAALIQSMDAELDALKAKPKRASKPKG